MIERRTLSRNLDRIFCSTFHHTQFRQLFSEFNLRRRPRGFRRKALKPYGPAAAAALYQQAAVHTHPASAAAAAAADAAALGLRHYELISAASAAAHAAASSPTGTPMSAQVQSPTSFENHHHNIMLPPQKMEHIAIK